MDKKAMIAVIVVAVVAIAAIAAFLAMNNDKGGDKDENVTLIMGTIEEVGPISTTSSSFYEQRRMIVQEPLISYAANGKFVNLTAASCTTSDNITWNIKLKDNVVWCDGEPYTATDVKKTVDIYSFARPNVVANIDSVTVIDDHSLTLVLKSAASELGGVLSNMPILPWHIWKDLNVTTADDYQKVTNAKAFYGTGPYKLSGLNATGDEITYVYNDKYYGGKPNVTKIILKYYGDEGAMVAALLAGEIDTIYNYGSPGVNGSYLGKIEEAKNVDYIKVSTGGIPADILLNQRNAIAADYNFRMALRNAIDYASIVKYVAPDTGMTPNAGLVPPTIDGFIETEKLSKDLPKAESYMKSYFDAHGLDWSKDKVRVDIIVWQNSNPDMFKNVYTLMKEQLALINIDLEPIDLAGKNVTVVAKDPSTVGFLWMMTDGAIKNYAGFATHYVSATGTLKFVFGDDAVDPKYEAIVDGMNAATTQTQKDMYAKQFQEYYAENAVVIPIFWGAYVQPYSLKYDGWTCGMASGLLCYENLFGLHKA